MPHRKVTSAARGNLHHGISVGRRDQPVTLHPAIKRRAMDAKRLGCALGIPPMHIEQGAQLQIFLSRQVNCVAGNALRERELDHLAGHTALTQHPGPLHDLLELANVAWPRVALEYANSLVLDGTLGQPAQMEKVPYKRSNVLESLHKRRNVDDDCPDAMREIRPKPAGCHKSLQWFIRCRNETECAPRVTARADRPKLLRLDRTE